MIREAKIFKNGQSQAVRLPKEYRVSAKSVYVNRLGDCLVLIPQNNPWSSMRQACSKFSEDFMGTREQGVFQEREDLE